MLKKDKCSKAVRITTPGSLSTLVFTSSLISIGGHGRAITANVDTTRCFLTGTGNFTSCVDAGLGNEILLASGAVDPNKQWITFESKYDWSMRFDSKLRTCNINIVGTIDAESCRAAYTPPPQHRIRSVYIDPLARRAWIFLLPPSYSRSSAMPPRRNGMDLIPEKALPIDQAQTSQSRDANGTLALYVTCAIDAQGEYTGCFQKQISTSNWTVVGPSQDASGIYIYDEVDLQMYFCENNLPLPYDLVSSIPAVEPYSMRFFSKSVVYFVGYNVSLDTYATYRCNVLNNTVFIDCMSIYSEPYGYQVFYYPANNGTNAYIAQVGRNPTTGLFQICDADPTSGIFDNCTTVFDDPVSLYFSYPMFSFPILF